MGSPSMIRFAVSEDGVWTVQKSIESHNHELARSKDQHLLRLCMNITDEKVSVLKSMTEAGIRIVDAFTYLRDEAEGDQAMARAIEIVLSQTRHRLCQWHINKKAPSKVSYFNSNQKTLGSRMSSQDYVSGTDGRYMSERHRNILNFHQLLENVASNCTTALTEMWRPATIPLATTIDLLKTTHANTLPQIDLSCHGSCN
ncbi:hypothetical protein M5K25_014606 [Dendrobium thyrsiflorum]|uniref:Protein FAR1-RELATED SEQUENCE n=1 Tax=Dendrobium thyrsiflorum TaxID=117978 RepID=A0ABD0UVD2_DENTH